MKYLIAIVVILPMMTCLGLAGALAYSGASGWVWSWFLLAGVLLGDMKIRVR